MADPDEDQVDAARRDAIKWLDRQPGKNWEVESDSDLTAWSSEIARQYNGAQESGLRRCPHLQAAPMQPSFWYAQAPDLLACEACESGLLAEIEKRLGHSIGEGPFECSVCREIVPEAKRATVLNELRKRQHLVVG